MGNNLLFKVRCLYTIPFFFKKKFKYSWFIAESEEELNNLLTKVKEESKTVGLKLNIQKTKIMASGPITSWQTDGKTVEKVADFILGSSKITADGDCSHEIKRRLLLGRKVMTKLDSILKSRDITLPTKVFLVKATVFPVVMYGYESWDYKESRAQKNWCFWTVVLEKTFKSPLDCKEIQPVYPKGDQSRVFIGRSDVEAETPVLWPPDAKSWLIGKDSDAGRDWGCWEEKGMTEDEMAGWHHRLDGRELEWWTGRPGMLLFMESQRVRHDWANELNWITNDIECLFSCSFIVCIFYLVRCLLRSFTHF